MKCIPTVFIHGSIATHSDDVAIAIIYMRDGLSARETASIFYDSGYSTMHADAIVEKAMREDRERASCTSFVAPRNPRSAEDYDICAQCGKPIWEHSAPALHPDPAIDAEVRADARDAHMMQVTDAR